MCAVCGIFGRHALSSLAVLIPLGAILQAATLMAVRDLNGRLGAETPVTAVRALSLLTPALLALGAAALIGAAPQGPGQLRVSGHDAGTLRRRNRRVCRW